MSMTAVATAPDTHQYLTVAEAAAFYRVHEDTLRAWIRKGLLRFPRARGDAPSGSSACEIGRMVPPRTRGCTSRLPAARPPASGSPAHAGMHPTERLEVLKQLRFPRARGDAPLLGETWPDPAVVPPRTRGCTLGKAGRPTLPGGSPAHAGMHPRRVRPCQRSIRFPRARGDAPSEAKSSESSAEVPPRTRGCTPIAEGRGQAVGGSPAHAGMHPPRCRRPPGRRRFPRARGDAPSPRTRF